jgi:hypothetical protein
MSVAMKTRRRKTTKVKRVKEPVAARRDGSAVNLQKELNKRTKELVEARKLLTEALEQQAATSNVLELRTEPIQNRCERRRNTSIRTVTELQLFREYLALGYERASYSNLPRLRPAHEAGANYSG